MPQDQDAGPLPDSVIGRYRLIRKLGEGGMGAVYLAERTEDFEQSVALKLVLEGLHLESTLSRFQVEQQALAALQHPNIVQIVDAGVSVEGIPYLAMDYVDGEPIDRHCDRQLLSVSQRIEIFLQVLEAVEYAHRRFLIHCDLKPSNILVTPEGQTKLLDFGVTKLLQPEVYGLEDGATKATLRPFTPEYASPEQLQAGTLTTATDVYSAGVVLYRLLCGQHPFEVFAGDPVKLMRSICEGDAEPVSGCLVRLAKRDRPRADGIAAARATDARQLGAALSGDLDAIVAKALRREPEKRYAGAAQFAADLRCFLANEPVEARVGGLRYRASKLLQRHKALVSSAALVLLVFGSGVGAWVWQAWRAEQSRVRAAARFSDVRKLTNHLLFNFYDAVAQLPGATPAQENLVRWSMSYLDDLSRRESSDSTLKLELAESYRKLGNLLGNPYENNLGKPEEAIATVTKGLVVMEQNTGAGDDSRDVLITMARLYGARSEIRWMANQSELCMKDAEESARLYDDLSRRFPNDYEVQMETAAKHDSAADLYAGAYQLDFDVAKALEHLNAATEYAQRAIAADPSQVRPYRALGIYQMKIADAMAYTDPEGAIDVYKEARRLFDEIPAGGKEELATKRAERALIFRSAWSYSALGRYAEAIAMYASLVAEHEEAIRLDPTNEKVHWDFSVVLRQRGEAMQYNGDYAGALADYSRCIDLVQRFLEEGLKGERRAALGEVIVYKGVVLAQLGRMQEAEAVTRRGLAILTAELDEPDLGESLLQRAAEAFIVAKPDSLRKPRLALTLLDRRQDVKKDQDAFYLLLRAEAMAGMGRVNEAVSLAQHAMTISTRHENVNYWKRLQTVAALH